MSKRFLIGLVCVAGSASSALALSNGDIILTNFNLDAITLISDPGGANTISNLITFNDIPSGGNDNPVRLGDITLAPNGDYYVSDGSIVTGDNNWDTSRIIKIQGLLGGAPVASNWHTGAGAGALMNPNGIRYDENYDGLFWVQTPFRRTGVGQVVNDGIYGAPLATPGDNLFFQEDTTGPRPFYEAGNYLEREPGQNSYLVTSLNGGVGGGASDGRASTLWRFTPDISNPANSTMTLVHDFTGGDAASTQAQIRGITAGPNAGEYFITNTNTAGAFGPFGTPGVYRLLLDGSGNFQSLTFITGQVLEPEAIKYNPFHNKLVVGSTIDQNNDGVPDGGIYQMDLDGSNVELLLANTHARGFSIVPTPGAISLLGLGGLAMLRRRR